jgi:hypothetical protein
MKQTPRPADDAREQERAEHRALVADALDRFMADPGNREILRRLAEYDRGREDESGGGVTV